MDEDDEEAAQPPPSLPAPLYYSLCRSPIHVQPSLFNGERLGTTV